VRKIKIKISLSITNYYIVSATETEVAPTFSYCKKRYECNIDEHSFIIKNNIYLHFIFTGVGALSTAHILHKLNIKNNSFLIQAGIAGSFNYNINLGNVLVVGADRQADEGAEDNDNYIDIFELNFKKANNFPYTNGWLFNTELPMPNYFNGLPKANAISVNCSSGSLATINKYTSKYKPTLESMEGATFHYYCLQHALPFVQIRAISNYVTVRNKSTWQIPLAISNLNIILTEFLNTL
jgi:futalosine hydrolase